MPGRICAQGLNKLFLIGMILIDRQEAGRQMRTLSNLPKPESKEFSSLGQLSQFVVDCANSERTIVPGRIRNLPVSAPRPVDFFVQAPGQDAILEHSIPDQVISVESGILIGRLAERLKATRQWFPVPEAFEQLSLMEVIDRGLAGSFEHCFGGLRELILGADVLLSSGQVIKCGGKVVKNVSGYDLTKMLIGAQGTIGFIVSAHLRLFALPEVSLTSCFAFTGPSSARSAALQLLRAGLSLSCVQLADARLVEAWMPDVKSTGMVALCAQMQGPRQLVQELDSAVSGIINGAATPVAGSGELELWQRLNEPAEPDVKVLILQGPGTLLMELIDRWSAGGRLPPWTMRPAANKLIVYVGAGDDIPALIAEAGAICTASGARAQCAGSDNELLWRVSYLPQDDPGRKELVARIKREFDPGAVFNPLVSL